MKGSKLGLVGVPLMLFSRNYISYDLFSISTSCWGLGMMFKDLFVITLKGEFGKLIFTYPKPF